MAFEINQDYSNKLYKYITHPNGWYTGLSIKKYVKKSIFSLVETFFNPAINSGRWSCYAHLDLQISFENIIQKYHITDQSRVIIHPLTPSNLVETVVKTGANIYFLDIDTTTLGIIPESLDAYLSLLDSQNLYPDLIVHFDSNGLYSYLEKEIEVSEKRSIPSIIVIDNNQINLDLVNVFQKLTLGSVILKSSQNSYLNEIFSLSGIESNLKTYLSFHVENRTRSIPEYHLRESHDFYKKLISCFLYLYNSQLYKSLSVKKIIWEGSKSFIIEKEHFPKSAADAKQIIQDCYKEITKYSLPDLVFDYLSDNLNGADEIQALPIENSLYYREASKQLFEFLRTYINQNDSKTDFVPDLVDKKEYLEFVFYTQHKADWIGYFEEQDIKCLEFLNYSGLINNQTNLKNTQLIVENGLKVSLSDYINVSKISL